jgi:hypothetical protein
LMDLPERLAAMLSDSGIDPDWDDRACLAEFYDEILHQDTCRPSTAGDLAVACRVRPTMRVTAWLWRHRPKAPPSMRMSKPMATRTAGSRT